MFNKKGFVDLDFEEINWMHLALSVIGAVVSLVIITLAEKSNLTMSSDSVFSVAPWVKIATPIVTFIAIYFYLNLTER